MSPHILALSPLPEIWCGAPLVTPLYFRATFARCLATEIPLHPAGKRKQNDRHDIGTEIASNVVEWEHHKAVASAPGICRFLSYVVGMTRSRMPLVAIRSSNVYRFLLSC